jgi:hypothetical protein
MKLRTWRLVGTDKSLTVEMPGTCVHNGGSARNENPKARAEPLRIRWTVGVLEEQRTWDVAFIKQEEEIKEDITYQ